MVKLAQGRRRWMIECHADVCLVPQQKVPAVLLSLPGAASNGRINRPPDRDARCRGTACRLDEYTSRVFRSRAPPCRYPNRAPFHR